MKSLFFAALIALLALSCNKEKTECPGPTEKSYDLSGFTKIKVGETHHVNITKGNIFSIQAKGCAGDLADLDLSIESDHILVIKYKNYKRNRYPIDFDITLPILTSINLAEAAKGKIKGFQGQNSVIRAVLSGASVCNLEGAGINVSMSISDASQLNVFGQTENLYGIISGASRLEAYGLAATEVDIEVSGSSKVFVLPIDKIFAAASGSSHIYYKGNPAFTHFETSGDGKIIHE